eukprot:1161879-Pelagomonas_calceolata.AAC.1
MECSSHRVPPTLGRMVRNVPAFPLILLLRSACCRRAASKCRPGLVSSCFKFLFRSNQNKADLAGRRPSFQACVSPSCKQLIQQPPRPVLRSMRRNEVRSSTTPARQLHELNVQNHHIHLIETKYYKDTRPGAQLEAHSNNTVNCANNFKVLRSRALHTTLLGVGGTTYTAHCQAESVTQTD